MKQQTFTEKVIDLLINGDMPSAIGSKATESGLIIVTSRMTPPVCASYGSSTEMAGTIAQIMEQNEPIRAVFTAAVGLYAKKHPDDPMTVSLKEFLR